MPVSEATTGAALRDEGSDSKGAHVSTSMGKGKVKAAGSPKWSTVIKRGKPLTDGKTGTCFTSTSGLRKPDRSLAIVGAGAAGHHIGTVKAKL
ncbi:hypothetical protein CRENBAI_006029, partial [Crenichthys baileyi]